MKVGLLLSTLCPKTSVFFHTRTVPLSYITSLLCPGIKDNLSSILITVFSNESLFHYFNFTCMFHFSSLSHLVNRLGRVSFGLVLNLLSYMSSETETAPVTEALLQLNTIYMLLDKRQEALLAARMRVLYIYTPLHNVKVLKTNMCCMQYLS